MQYTPYILPLILAVLPVSALAVHIRQQRHEQKTLIFLVLIGCMGFWALGHALELSLTSQNGKYLATSVTYLAIVTVPVMWLLMALDYVGMELRNHRALWFLLVEPIATLCMVWTNDLHHLYYTRVELVTIDGLVWLATENGPWFWIHVVYDYALVFSGSLILIRALLRSNHLHRPQIVTALAGISLPWMANVLYISGFSPFPGLDLTPISFLFAGLMMSLALFRFRFLDIVPVARDTIVENMDDGVIVLDDKGRVAYLNQALPQTLVCDPLQVLGQPFVQTFPELHRLLDGAEFEKQGYAELTLNAGAELRSYAVRYRPIRKRRGRFTGRLIVLHDISERKRTELDQLRMKEEAEAANHAKSTFLANMSHEIRTPLNAILGYAQILQSDPRLYDDHLSAIRAIERGGDHLLSIINDILDLSKIEAGRQELTMGDFDLEQMVESLSSIFSLRCEQQGLNWQVTIELAQSQVQGDMNKLQQVLVNLLANAVRFTEAGQVRLHIKNLAENRYSFEVSDTGRGIATAQQQIIFEPFQQEDETDPKGGTGLGLAIAHRHVELMGGRLQLDSTPGEGTRFFFELDLAAADGEIEESTSERTSIARLAPDYAVQALVVDDIAENRDVLSQILTCAGVEVDLAKNGEDALARVRQRLPDIVFMDIRMPGLDGSETRRQLIAEHGADTCKIVAVTASALTHQQQQYLDEGFDCFIDKPFRSERIFSCLNELLGVEFEHDPLAANLAAAHRDHTLENIALPEAIRSGLVEAVRIHSITQLYQQLDTLEAVGRDEQRLATHLRLMVRRFDMKGIKNIVVKLPVAEAAPVAQLSGQI